MLCVAVAGDQRAVELFYVMSENGNDINGEAFYKGEGYVRDLSRLHFRQLLLNNAFSRFFASGMDGPTFLATCIAILRSIRSLSGTL